MSATGNGERGDERDPRLARLYAEASREEPPAALDQALLAAARREAGSRPRWRTRRWGAPLAAAAVVVLSVTVGILVRQAGPGAGAPSKTARPGEPRSPGKAAPARLAEPVPAAGVLRIGVPGEASGDAGSPSSEPHYRMIAPPPAASEQAAEPGASGVSPARRAARAAESGAALEAPRGVLGAAERQVWLARIAALLAAGRRGEARSELERLLARDPEVALPPAIAALRER